MPWNWTDGDFASSRRMNMGSTQKMTGTEIAAVVSADVEPGVLIYCTTTGSGYTANNLYQRNDDNTGYDIVGLKGHTHTDAESGGRQADVNIANLPLTLSVNKRFARTADWWQTVVSSGTITDSAANGRIELQSGTTSGGAATISEGGAGRLNFAYESGFEATLAVSSSTNFQVKIGAGAEDINGGNLTPPKYGIEACSTSGTNWLIFSSSGTTRSTTATSAPVVQAVNKYRVVCTPGTSVDFYIGGTLVGTKTLDVPASGNTGYNDVFRAGIKNSAGENKVLQWYGVEVEGTLL